MEPAQQARSPEYVYAAVPKLRFDQRRLARVVGVVAFGLPIVLGLGGLAMGEFRTALSGYYYEEFFLGDVFVGALAFIGSLLFAYRGYTPKVARLASFAGVAALLVAFVPMEGWVTGCEQLGDDGACVLETRLFPRAGYWIHAGSAGVLFGVLAYFCFFIFTRVPADRQNQPLSDAKRMRNLIYRASGAVIVIAALSIAAGDRLAGGWWNDNNMTFWMEALLLGAFGTSWMVQGRAVPPQLKDPQDRADAAEAKAQADGSAADS